MNSMYKYHDFRNGQGIPGGIFSRTSGQFLNDLSILNKRSTLLFDDGTKSQFTIAFNILLQNKWERAIFFIITSMVGTNCFMNWDHIREVAKYYQIGVHTHTHPDGLELLGKNAIMEEIAESKNLITENIKRTPLFFSSPYDSVGPNVKEAAFDSNLWLIEPIHFMTVKNNTEL